MKHESHIAIGRAMRLHVPSLPAKAHPDLEKLDALIGGESIDEKQLLELKLLANKFGMTEAELQTRAANVRRGSLKAG